MIASQYHSRIFKMSPYKILHVMLVTLSCCVLLCPRYCYPLLLERSAEVLLASMNTSIDPCEDFYGFACGSYAQNVSANSEPLQTVKNLMLENISNFLEMNSSSNDPLILNKARTLYRSCLLNSSDHRNQSLKSIAHVLELVGLSPTPPLDGGSENFSHVFTMARSKVIFNMDFFLQPMMSRENSTHVSLSLGKPTDENPFSMSSKHRLSRFMANNNTNAETHEHFLEYARNITKAMHVYANKTVPNLISSEFNSTVKNLHFLDMFLDYVTGTPFSFDFKTRNFPLQKNVEWLQNLTEAMCSQQSAVDKFNWTEYIAILMEDEPGMSLNSDKIVIWESFYVQFILYWVECQMGLQELELYMWWKTVTQLAPYSAIGVHSNRHVWCADKVNDILPQATALMLVNRNDTIDAMKKIKNMTEDIRDVFNGTITNATWMNQTEKDTISKKMMDIRICVGHPLWLNDSKKVDKFYTKYDKVDLVESDFLANILKLVQIEQRMKKLTDKQGNTTECTFKSLEVNSFFSPFLNQLVIPSGFLQFPYYGHVLAALNFGSIGTTIGHELSHGFDSFRMEFLDVFRGHNATQTEYARRIQCFVDHYGNYSKPNASKENSENENLLLNHTRYSIWMAEFKHWTVADGQRTVDENLSDSNGLKITFDTYRDHSRKRAPESSPYGLEKYSQEQLFFIAYANTYCSRYSHSSFGDSTDVHSPDSIRVWGALRNSEDFAKTWGCKKGSWMNPNAEKCEAW